MEKSLKQGTSTWLEVRSKHITATDACAIMGVSPWKKKRDLWLEKLGLGEPIEENDAMREGRNSEETIRTEYMIRTGYQVKPAVRFSRTVEFMMASLDGIDHRGLIAIECKLANKEDHFRALTKMIVPEKYYPQLQHIISVCNLDHIFYCSYNPFSFEKVEQFTYFPVDKDSKYIDDLIFEERKFWDCVRNFQEPEPGPNELKRMDSERWKELALLWQETKEKIKFYQISEEVLRKNLIKLANNESCEGGGIKLLKSVRKGNIDYSNIPELKQIDLETYRKEPTTFWRIHEI